MAAIDISKIIDSKTPIHVEVEAWNDLISKKDLFPNATLHIGDTFVSLKNENGDHLISVGIKF